MVSCRDLVLPYFQRNSDKIKTICETNKQTNKQKKKNKEKSGISHLLGWEYS